MLLSISTTHYPATDLGYLLHKHPEKVQQFELNFGKATVFYPEVSEHRCTATLYIDVDPVGLVRGSGKGDEGFRLEQYVNDRPYVASSFLSVAIGKVFNSARAGSCKDRPKLVQQALPFEVSIPVVPVTGGSDLIRKLFEPLGYNIESTALSLDERFPEWGSSRYFSVRLTNELTLQELLSHLYVLIPVMDDAKHYYITEGEVEKLVEQGTGWLNAHPEKDLIASRYLKRRKKLISRALEQLVSPEAPDEESEETLAVTIEAVAEEKLSLHKLRLENVFEKLKSLGVNRIADLGCGEGKLLRLLLKEKQFEQILGMDVSYRALEMAADKLHLEEMTERQRKRIQLVHGSLTYKDARLTGFDAAVAVEVIEHLDKERLKAFEKVVFVAARPKHVIITTPNSEYNTMWPSLPAGKFRHPDHRFEFTRAEFQNWCQLVGQKSGYSFAIEPLGPVDDTLGGPSQMAIFSLEGLSLLWS